MIDRKASDADSKSRKIVMEQSKCSRCFLCQMICSFHFTGAFHPEAAKISVSWNHEGDCTIDFNEDCTNCGLCARYCVYGALSLSE